MPKSSISDVTALPTYQNGFHSIECEKMIYKPFGNTGLIVSALGFGGATLALCYNTDKEQESIQTVIKAIQSGIKYIDTAPYYGDGKAEIVLGKALKCVPRNTYYLATKIGRYGTNLPEMFDFTEDCTFKSVEESLSRLGVEYLDVLQVHDLEYAPSVDIILNETLPALQKLKEMGKTKYIGITGYPLSLLKEVVERSTIQIDVVLSYCRCTLFDNSLKTFIPFFKERKMAVINAAAVGMGLLTEQGPPDWHPAGKDIKDACLKAVQLCQERNVNISKLAFCHSLSQSEDINVHLIGMATESVLRANLTSLWNGLSDYELSVKEEVIKIFADLKETHWENVELKRYWEAVSNQRIR